MSTLVHEEAYEKTMGSGSVVLSAVSHIQNDTLVLPSEKTMGSGTVAHSAVSHIQNDAFDFVI